MRNLAILSITADQIGIPEPPRCLVINAVSDTSFIATSNEVYSYCLSQKKIVNSVKIPSSKGIVSMECLVDDELLSVATSNGDLYEWRYTIGSLECMGTIDAGINCMKWSSDQEIMVLVTGDEKLILMTRDLEPYFEAELNPADFGQAQLITVGWGKKETQFHGSEGKPKLKDTEQKTDLPILPLDDKRARVSWFDDGQAFAISSVDHNTGSRKIRVRLNDGSLFSTSDDIYGLEHALHCRPSGNLVASSHRKPNKHDIVFFEKNGLRHGEFSLPFSVKEVQVIELSWNRTSEVLAIWMENLDDGTTPKETPLSCLQLWTRNNYHWYLKQELVYSAMGLHISSIMWDVEIPLKLHVVCAGGEYYQLTWHWKVSTSQSSCVAVIDGANLLLTPFTKCVVPPPMCHRKMLLSSSINQISFAGSSDLITVALSDGTLNLLKISDDNIIAEKFQVIHENRNEVAGPQNGCNFFHLLHWMDNSYLAVRVASKHDDTICYLKATKDDASKILVRKSVPQKGKVCCTAMSSDLCYVAFEMENGDILTCHKVDDDIVVRPWLTPSGYPLTLPHLCESISVCKVNHQDFLIGRTSHFLLYINDKQIVDNCTSFAVHDEFLVYTSHDHSLHCLLLSRLLNFLHSGNKEDLFANEFKRSLERGAKIITAVSQDTKVILQMPRGNLETIHPRPLVVSLLKHLLDRMAYKDAVMVMKRHRINLNLIHDHHPQLFLENVGTFITQVTSVSDINLFLADLIEDDLTRSLYASSYDKTAQEHNGWQQSCNKIDGVCLAIRESIQKIGTMRFFLPFLTSYVKQTLPDLERVLIEIKKLKDKIANMEVTYDQALKHILYMTDVNDLYNVALGLYDFDIILMIAEKSNKDPKEYLPFLNDLRTYDEYYYKFKIDCHLKRYTKALGHIYSCGESRVSEFLDFLVSQSLYKEALDLCANDHENLKKVSVLYGSDLAKQKSHNEAGLVFSKVGYHEEALQSFVDCLSWKLALCEAAKLQYSKDRINQLAKSLAGRLKDKKRWVEAVTLYEIYVQDFESAIITALDGYLWEDAMRMIYGCGRLDLIETNFTSALLDSYNYYCDVINDSKKRYLQYKQRLSVLRELKKNQSAEIQDTNRDEIENDLFSEASSVTGHSSVSRSSKGSRASGNSSKSRRKQQRKNYSLKEGSKFEAFALMEALADIINSTDKLQDNIGTVLQMLVLFSCQVEALKLQNGFTECISIIETTMDPIWSYKADTIAKQPAMGPGATVNSIIAELSASQNNLPTESSDLPQLARPTLRKNVHWKLVQLT